LIPVIYDLEAQRALVRARVAEATDVMGQADRQLIGACANGGATILETDSGPH
jgi:hypothetical protein